MGISTRSDSGRAPPNTADSDPARSTQTRESIVAFKLPSYSGGLSLPEFRATSGRICMYGYVRKSRALRSVLIVRVASALRVRFFMRERKKKNERGERERGKFGPRSAVPAEQSGPGVDPVSAHRTPGRSDVRSALTCWIRRECDAKVNRSVEAVSTRFNLGTW